MKYTSVEGPRASPPAFLFLHIPGGPAAPRLRRTMGLVRRSFSVGGGGRGRPRSISCATEFTIVAGKLSARNRRTILVASRARASKIRHSPGRKSVRKNRARPNRLTRKNIRRKFSPKIRVSFQLFCGVAFLCDCARRFASPCWVFSREGKRAWTRDGSVSTGRRSNPLPPRGSDLRARASCTGRSHWRLRA
jgi:hypothetical protein